MEHNEVLILLIAMVLMSIGTFWLGYETATDNGKEARRALLDRMRLEEKKKHELTRWVRENWPSEYIAWVNGHREGYQQGVLQSADLEPEN